jgi:DNA helicase IV
MMALSHSIEKLDSILQEINRNKIYLFFGYILVPIYLGVLILRRIKPKLETLEKQKSTILKNITKLVEKAINDTQKTYKSIIKEDTYIIYSKKEEISNSFNNYLKQLSYLESKNNIFEESFNKDVQKAYTNISQTKEKLLQFNEEFVKRRKKEYASLFTKEGMTLDDSQKTAIVTDDKHNLVVAGAGSGKTEVLITRIAYLIKRKPDTIQPNRILALAFQNKAANEVKERLKTRFNVDVKVKTFHALGKEILELSAKQSKRKSPRLKFSGDNFEKEYRGFIKKIFLKAQEDKDLQNDLVNYMKYYADDEIVKEEADFGTKEDYYKYVRELTYTALDGTKVKSEAEREILNFFITHNIDGEKIKVLYESPAEWMKYTTEEGERIPSPDFYFPDFDLYLEHWALNKAGKAPKWFTGDNPTEEYKKAMELKKQKFSDQEQYKLIETFSWEYQNKDFLKKLKNRFIAEYKEKHPDKEAKLQELGYKDLVNKVWEECKESTKALALNVGRYIIIAKTYSLDPKAIDKRLEEESWSKRQKAFAKIALKLYQEYEKELHKDGSIDFADMINLAVIELNKKKKLYADDFDHILIDEYQDISTQRYELIDTLMNKNHNCKLFCVGDDWQSIMGFAGANLDFFVNFEKYFDQPARTDLPINYRSTKSVVDTGAQIIKHNKDVQLQKKTISSNGKIKNVKVYTLLHQAEYRKNYIVQMVKHCIDKIEELLKDKYKPEEIMILARIVNSPLIRDSLLDYARNKKIPITMESNRQKGIPFMSVHRSKGLQAKVVFILNVDKDLYGFPCELENPDMFDTAIKGKRKDREEEERRLFYVAVTRAKEEVYIYNQKCAESKFLKEIKDLTDIEELPY